MSFAGWVNNGWLVAHKSSKQEIGNLLGIVARDLKDSQAKDVSDDWRFAIAYNAALQAATAALAADGYRASRENHHYWVDSLERGHTLEEFVEGYPTVSREMAVAALEEAQQLLSAQA